MAYPEFEAPSGAPQVDDLDALFEVDRDMDDIFDTLRKGNDTEGNNTREPKEVTYGRTHPTDSLGIDEEIKITKKRAPVAKLDEARLLSDNGIPKLQRITRSRFKFKGKGHEFSDVALILRTYQQWLDDLYPRAKFADGLTIIEKLGHSRRVQVQRRQWLDESRPKASMEDEDDFAEALPVTPDPGPARAASEIVLPGTNLTDHSPQPTRDRNERNESSDRVRSREISTNGSPDQVHGGEPDEDELDALLNEGLIENGKANEIAPQVDLHRPRPPVEDVFKDDENVMREMADMDELW